MQESKVTQVGHCALSVQFFLTAQFQSCWYKSNTLMSAVLSVTKEFDELVQCYSQGVVRGPNRTTLSRTNLHRSVPIASVPHILGYIPLTSLLLLLPTHIVSSSPGQSTNRHCYSFAVLRFHLRKVDVVPSID